MSGTSVASCLELRAEVRHARSDGTGNVSCVVCDDVHDVIDTFIAPLEFKGAQSLIHNYQHYRSVYASRSVIWVSKLVAEPIIYLQRNFSCSASSRLPKLTTINIGSHELTQNTVLLAAFNFHFIEPNIKTRPTHPEVGAHIHPKVSGTYTD